ncbi:MAG TPA: rhomboid family intramembrane serine protease [Flavisolibacter sp.]|jgi:rhomboid-like protein|nr:rhomboid family intramembrane serine protease [Flavisolibacter sp.]
MSNYQFTRPDAFPPIVKNLIIINAIVWIAQNVFDSQYNLTGILALYPVQSEAFRPYQIATHMFAHAPLPAIYHIFFNMFTLFVFGRVLESRWGPKRFLLFYLLCGVGAAACHLGVQYFRYEHAVTLYNLGQVAEAKAIVDQLGPALGASGAIMGIVVAFGYLFPNTEMYLMFIPIPIKAKWLVLFYVAYDLIYGFGNFGDNVAHFAHLGGALTGFILVLIWNKTDRRRFY